MSFDRVPSKAEVMGWNPIHLADYLKKMDLSGSDKVVLRCSMNGSRFLNMSENDLQKFPKLHAPLISKICREINRKEERRGLFGKKSTVPKYHEPDTPVEDQGWGEDEFDSDDDYESPDADEDQDGGSVGDYEDPTEEEGGASDNEYEPPPSEPPEELQHKLCPSLPMGDGIYIDNRNNHTSPRGPPPVVTPRPSVTPHPAQARPSLVQPAPTPARREPSPHQPGRLPGKMPSGPPAPQVDRSKKPSMLERAANHSPVQVRKLNTADRPTATSRRCQPEERVSELTRGLKLPAPPSSSLSSSSSLSPSSSSFISRSNSSARLPSNRFVDERNETYDEGQKHHTFPLQSRAYLTPHHGQPPGPPSRHTDSLPAILSSGGSLPHKLQTAMSVHRSSSRVSAGLPCPGPAFLPPGPAFLPPGPAFLPPGPAFLPPGPAFLPPGPTFLPPGPAFLPPGPAFLPPVPASLPPTPSDPQTTQDLDPRWYVGKVTRRQAEGCLRHVNKDGAYLVRDSTKQLSSQPYTLMVLYQNKVYNIQIRQQNQQYQLGTGLKAQETFPSVSGIIGHYSHSPLILIDAKNRGSGQQNQCLLSEPAAY